MTASRPNWIAISCLGATAVAAFYVFIALIAPMPQDGQMILYWLALAYNYTALQIAIGVTLVALSALFFWIPQAVVKRAGYQRDGWRVGIACLAMVASVWSALPLGRLIYRDWGSVAANGKSYRLGLRVSPDAAQNAYVFLECDALAFLCRGRYLYDDSLKTLKPLPTVKFDPLLNKVQVQIEARTLYETQP